VVLIGGHKSDIPVNVSACGSQVETWDGHTPVGTMRTVELWQIEGCPN